MNWLTTFTGSVLLPSKHQHMLMLLSNLPSLKRWPPDMDTLHHIGAFEGDVLVTRHLFLMGEKNRPFFAPDRTRHLFDIGVKNAPIFDLGT